MKIIFNTGRAYLLVGMGVIALAVACLLFAFESLMLRVACPLGDGLRDIAMYMRGLMARGEYALPLAALPIVEVFFMICWLLDTMANLCMRAACWVLSEGLIRPALQYALARKVQP